MEVHKLKKAQLSMLILCSILAISSVFSYTQVQAVEVKTGYTSYVPGRSYKIVMKDLTVSTSYVLAITAGCASNYTFTTGADETQVSPRIVLEKPTSGSECLLQLVTAAATGTVLSQVRMQVADVAQIIDQDGLVTIIMILVVLGVLMGIFVGLYRRKGM